MRVHHHSWGLGRCRHKGCQHITKASALTARCPEHGVYQLRAIVGVESPEIKCDARCQNAIGPSCSCSCGGKNHGDAHAV